MRPLAQPVVLAVLVLSGNLRVSAQRVPFVLPWDDVSTGITDFSALNSPVGTSRVAVDAQGHFSANGQRIRFLGMNFAGDAPFMPTNYAEAVAGRAAKFGINAVRFHHMDAPWAFNGGLLAYNSLSSTNFNAVNLDRVHFLVSRLKAHGIYSDMNLLVGREYRPGDGLGPEVTSMNWKDTHVLGFFYDPALALQKDYATKLLSPTNSYTGLPLAKDPAVAFVEIINENGIIANWLGGSLDLLPARYAAALQSKWNSWLAARYTNDAQMLAAWNVVDQTLGTNLLANGSFSNGLTGWVTEQHYNARATFARTSEFINGQPCARVTVTTPDTTGWYIQLNYPGLRVVSNQVYTISFWAESSPSTNADVSVMQAHDSYAGLGYYQALALTTNWQAFTNTFQASKTDTDARVNFGSMGDKPAVFRFADVRLQAGGQMGMLPAGTSLAGRSVPVVHYSGTGYTGTLEARSDWLRFLRDLESTYYDAMVGHLRTNIGYTGLVFGTIMANSPATVQSRMDVIDGHAYWQHPQFPGQPWDPVSWLQPNISIVNTFGDDNTLAGLARQRIRGKPFTVTEYQHPSPNYYGSEGPLLLAAYAGLQDWDGLWLFAYGQGNPAGALGYVSDYFSTAQHPGKMANLLLAASLFRRGDVSPAAQEITMALTPEGEMGLLAGASAWNVFSSSQLGVPAGLAFVSRLDTCVGVNATGLTTCPPAPSSSILGSDTGELQWDLSQPGKGVVTVNSSRTKAVAGFADGRAVNLGGITLQPAATQLRWCTLAMTLRRGEVFTNDCTALIVATGWWENTGEKWTDPNKVCVSTNWGMSPVLTEVVPFSVTLPVGTNHVAAWSLNERGQRKSQLPLSGNASFSTLTVGTNAGSIWYELDVDRWVASYDLWRARYFALADLTNSAVSGVAAAPDGDRVPNLLKYYLGLPGRTPAPRDRLPAGGLVQVSDASCLALTYAYDVLATDVSCAAQVSTDLEKWFSGNGYTTLAQTTNLGSLQQLTVRDLTPVSMAPARFMRLLLQRQ